MYLVEKNVTRRSVYRHNGVLIMEVIIIALSLGHQLRDAVLTDVVNL